MKRAVALVAVTLVAVLVALATPATAAPTTSSPVSGHIDNTWHRVRNIEVRARWTKLIDPNANSWVIANGKLDVRNRSTSSRTEKCRIHIVQGSGALSWRHRVIVKKFNIPANSTRTAAFKSKEGYEYPGVDAESHVTCKRV